MSSAKPLASVASRVASFSSSSAQAASQTSRRADSISVAISASMNAIAWRWAIASPKAVRVFA